METKDNEAPITCSYDDFEPFCKWRREQARDLLEVHGLQGFKKEQLKVRINNGTVLIITGERPLKNNIRCRFRKEIKVSKHCKADEIRAKFGSAGILRLSFPMKTSSASTKLRNESLPSNYLVDPETSACYRLKLAVAVSVPVLVMAIAAFLFKYCRCVQVET
ncbi:uncharacterized protein LOC110623697 [Manihot esculenta]|uniref:SHSP domain-containing protein n=1 Tax=Manihot esculenta TaxID=3983 RepID=A0A2C9VAM5_MANES|nr:uncharacterized protein LOC110623697 [Manihot esculenta]OAY41906.1 hypothetical protein MANES_09G138700v8 [Manihot esculenta]